MRSVLNSIQVEENKAYEKHTDLAKRFINAIEPHRPLTLLRDVDSAPGHLPLRDSEESWFLHSNLRAPQPVLALTKPRTLSSFVGFKGGVYFTALESGDEQPSSAQPKELPPVTTDARLSSVFGFKRARPSQSLLELALTKLDNFTPFIRFSEAINLIMNPALILMGPDSCGQSSGGGSVRPKSNTVRRKRPQFQFFARCMDDSWLDAMLRQKRREMQAEARKNIGQYDNYFYQCIGPHTVNPHSDYLYKMRYTTTPFMPFFSKPKEKPLSPYYAKLLKFIRDGESFHHREYERCGPTESKEPYALTLYDEMFGKPKQCILPDLKYGPRGTPHRYKPYDEYQAKK